MSKKCEYLQKLVYFLSEKHGSQSEIQKFVVESYSEIPKVSISRIDTSKSCEDLLSSPILPPIFNINAKILKNTLFKKANRNFLVDKEILFFRKIKLQIVAC